MNPTLEDAGCHGVAAARSRTHSEHYGWKGRTETLTPDGRSKARYSARLIQGIRWREELDLATVQKRDDRTPRFHAKTNGQSRPNIMPPTARDGTYGELEARV